MVDKIIPTTPRFSITARKYDKGINTSMPTKFTNICNLICPIPFKTRINIFPKLIITVYKIRKD
jgi:hypothetical protein